MPRLNIYEQRTTPDGGLGSGPNARAAPVVDVGAAIAGAGQSFERAALRIEQNEERARIAAERARAESERAGIAEAQRQYIAARSAFSQQFIHARENNADDPNFTETFAGTMDAYIAQVMEPVTDKFTRTALTDRLTELREDYIVRSTEFESGERVRRNDAIFEESLNNAANLAMGHPNEVPTIVADMMVYAENANLSSAMRAQLRDRIRMIPMSAAMTVANDPARAQAILALRGSQDPEAGPAYWNMLAPQQRLQVLTAAESTVRQAENQAEEGLRAARILQQAALQDQLAAYSRGDSRAAPPPPEEHFIAVYGEGTGTLEYQKAQIAYSLIPSLNTIRMGTPEEVRAIEQSVQANPQSADYSTQLTRQEVIENAVRQRRQALNDDPGGYVLANSEGVRTNHDAMMAALSSDLSDDQIMTFVNAYNVSNMNAQTRLGQPNVALPDSTVEAFVGRYNQAYQQNPRAAALWAQRIGTAFHSQPYAISQLAEAGGPSFVMAMEGVDGAVVDEINRIRGLDANGRAAMRGSRSNDDITNAVTTAMQPAIDVLAGQRNTERAAAYREAAELLTLGYVSQGMSPDEAATKAYQNLIGSRYDIPPAARYMVPRGSTTYTTEGVQRGADRYLNALTADQIGSPNTGVTRFTDLEAERARLVPMIRRNGVWVNNQTMTGLMLINRATGQYVLGPDGRPIDIPFEELEHMPAPAQQQTNPDRSMQARGG